MTESHTATTKDGAPEIRVEEYSAQRRDNVASLLSADLRSEAFSPKAEQPEIVENGQPVLDQPPVKGSSSVPSITHDSLIGEEGLLMTGALTETESQLPFQGNYLHRTRTSLYSLNEDFMNSPIPLADRSNPSFDEVATSTQSEIHAIHPLGGLETSIRVLDVEASTNPNTDRTIKAQLRVVDLADKPIFAALSYVWGEKGTPPNTINCGHHTFEVTKSCWSAIWHLRKKLGKFTIWIDAICIDQMNDQEKAQQIELMGTIYSSAEVVYVWLGVGNKRTDEAMDYLSTGTLPFRHFITAKIEKNIPTGAAMSLRLGLHLYLRALTWRTKPHASALRELFGREWISRMWTLQEILLARNATFVCGEKAISWVEMLFSLETITFFAKRAPIMRFPDACIQWIRLVVFWEQIKRRVDLDKKIYPAFWHDDVDFLDSELPRHVEYLQKGWKLFTGLVIAHVIAIILAILLYVAFLTSYSSRHLYNVRYGIPISVCYVFLYVTGTMVTLLDRSSGRHPLTRFITLPPHEALLVQIATRKCLFARDRYYGLNGILSQHLHIRKMRARMKKINRVYWRLTLDLIIWTDSLDILILGTLAKRLERTDIPSWIIDWNGDVDSTHWIYACYHYIELPWYKAFGTKYERFSGATRGSESIWNSTNTGALELRGMMIGEISFCSEAGIPPFNGNLLQSVRDFQAACDGLEPTRVEQILTELTSVTEQYSPASRRTLHLVRRWCKIMHEGRSKGPEWTLKHLKYKNWFRRVGGRSNCFLLQQQLAEYISDHGLVVARCSGPCDSFGIASSGAQEGDAVALISRISMPMILRPQGTEFKLVGPALLGGTMNGQLWTEEIERSLQDIVLI